MDRHIPKTTKIPITVRITGNPLPVINKIFEIEKDSKDSRFTISRKIEVGDGIGCMLKEYTYRNQPGAPQDVSLIFEVSGTISNSSKISEFLYSKLRGFKKILIIFNKQEFQVDKAKIEDLLEKHSEGNS